MNEKFILVKHEAIRRGLHYDLRFQIPGTKNWASFSMTKFPPLEPGRPIYIPRSNDHSEQEALFLGEIPEGEYGAGKLSKIDDGNCDVIKFSSPHIAVDFKGRKLKGVYHFVNVGVFGGKQDYKNKVYKFFKGKLGGSKVLPP